MLRDDGPPVSQETINEARQSLPLEYGWKIVTERGRKVLLVLSPKPKPDYLRELQDVALYVPLEQTRDLKDVMLVGTEKSVRLEPLKLRDCIKTQQEEDVIVAEDLLRRLARDYGTTKIQSPHHHDHQAFAIRIPRRAVGEISAEDVIEIRARMGSDASAKVKDCQMAYILADTDFERLGRRTFLELVAPEAVAPAPAPAEAAAPAAPNAADALKAAALASTGASFAPAPVAAAPAYAPPPTRAAPPAAVAAPAAEAAPMGPYGETQPMKTHMENTHADDNCEVYVRKAPGAPAPQPARAPPRSAPVAPSAPAAPAPVPALVARQPAEAAPTTYSDGPTPQRAFEVTHATEEFEVFVSKPKVAAAPPMPVLVPQPPDPAPVAAPPVVAVVPGPAHDVGAPVEPSVVARVDEVGTLRIKFESLGYEIMTDVEVLGQRFEIAAHKMGGKRILVKRVERFDAAAASTLVKTATDLGADVCLAISEDVAPGARLATWGTRVVVVGASEAATLDP